MFFYCLCVSEVNRFLIHVREVTIWVGMCVILDFRSWRLICFCKNNFYIDFLLFNRLYCFLSSLSLSPINIHDLTNFPTLTTDCSSLVSGVSLWWNFFIYNPVLRPKLTERKNATVMFLNTKWYFSCHEAQSVNDHATFNFIQEKQRKTLLVSTTLWSTWMKNEVQCWVQLFSYCRKT